jgi:hypothetical protein
MVEKLEIRLVNGLLNHYVRMETVSHNYKKIIVETTQSSRFERYVSCIVFATKLMFVLSA